MNIQKVIFKRLKDSEWEDGIMINEDQLIIDAKGNPVKRLYDYNRQNYIFCMNIPLKGEE